MLNLSLLSQKPNESLVEDALAEREGPVTVAMLDPAADIDLVLETLLESIQMKEPLTGLCVREVDSAHVFQLFFGDNNRLPL
jgi:hypothetical protein